MVTMKKPTLFATAAASLPALALASPPFNGAPSAFMPSAPRASSNLPGRRRYCLDNDVPSPQSIAALPPGKGDLYSDEELFELLNIHQSLNPEEEKGLFSGGFDQEENAGDLNEESIAGGIHDWVLETLNDGESGEPSSPANGFGKNGDTVEASAIPGLHELILETIEDIESSSSSKVDDDASVNQMAFDNLRHLLADKKPSIRAIATDVDGTLLKGKYLHPTTQEVLLKAINHSYLSPDGAHKIEHFFPATGKSRKGAADSLGPIIGPLLYQCPGVYVQGLYCVDKEGNVVFEKKLPPSAVKAAEEFVSEFDISIVGYDGDNLYSTELTDVVIGLSEHHGEATVELIDGGDNDSIVKLVKHEPGFHKMLLMDDDVEKLKSIRPRLEKLAKENGATVTLAIPTMLELLPEGCSKAFGVGKVCEALGIDASKELLALGDAENDAGMLRDAAIGVAVGNACPQAMEAADFIMTERNDEGGAGLAMNLFGFDI
jgi:hydroxymethylpyrimidine pyrophosphatase-like HAD family hydrolase